MTIVGENEFLNRLNKFSKLSFTPGERSNFEVMDTHDLRYVESGDFCANLHIHTLYSDGIMSIPEFIQNAKSVPNILTAITDHDTLEGAKELYNNQDNDFDVVLGIEISTVAINFPNQTKPVSIHLLVYGIDPFDKELNDFLEEKKEQKLQLANETIKELNDVLPGYNFNLNEAAKCHPLIAKGQDEIAHPLRKYTSGKILFDYYFPKADFSYEEPIFKYKYLFQGTEPYFISYKKALENYIHSSLPLIPDEIIEKLNIAKEIYSKAHPKIGHKMKQFAMFEDTVKFISGLKQGIMSVAHPARYKAYTTVFYNYLFDNFKQFGKNKAICYEKYYQSYEGRYYKEWKDIIDSAAAGLIPTGGLDTHGSDIKFRGAHY